MSQPISVQDTNFCGLTNYYYLCSLNAVPITVQRDMKQTSLLHNVLILQGVTIYPFASCNFLVTLYTNFLRPAKTPAVLSFNTGPAGFCFLLAFGGNTLNLL